MFFWGNLVFFWKFELIAVRRVFSVPNSLGPLGGLRLMPKGDGSKATGGRSTRALVKQNFFGPNPPVMPAAGNGKFLASVAGGLRCLARQSQASASHANRIYAQRLACALSTRGVPSTHQACGRVRGPAGSRPTAKCGFRTKSGLLSQNYHRNTVDRKAHSAISL